jgi:hypothetical protein
LSQNFNPGPVKYRGNFNETTVVFGNNYLGRKLNTDMERRVENITGYRDSQKY